MRKRFLVVPLIALVLLTGCAKSVDPNVPANVAALNTGATITQKLAQSLKLVEDGIRQANAAGFVDTPTTASVLVITRRLNQAGIQADNVLRSQAVLSPDQKISVKTLLDPLVAEVQKAIDVDVIKITNTSTRSQIQASLNSIQLVLKSTIAALEAK